MKKTVGMCTAALLTGVILAGESSRPDWENLDVNSLNRLPPRTYAMPLASEAAALTEALEPSTPYVKSLNGVWKYSWAGNPALRVLDFWKTDYDDSDWLTIDVPSCIELRGFGVPGYTNVRYPHAYDVKRDTHAPTIRDRQSDAPDYNPVSSYRTTFTVPDGWQGRDVILRFDGVYSAYYVWVNGKKVGYAEDSKLPSEFDITACLNASGATNLLCVEVYRWCDGSFLEDQDMTRFSGIFRDVTLWAKPKDGLWDFRVRTTPVEGSENWNLEVTLTKGASAVLYDADRKRVGDLMPVTDSDFSLRLRPNLWSAEKPYLYTLVVKKGSDIRMKRIGFKEQRIQGNVFLVNGKPVKFKGVNRHETNPDNGRTVSLADMIRDVTLMKRYNVNAVRTSHYPDHHLWYDLCDRYGLYVIAEANVEGHEPGYKENGLGAHAEWNRTIVERNERHVVFYRNNPCVTMWSMGNETGHGDCFRNAIAAVKRIDPSRPVHWERGNLDADIDSRMYPTVEWLESRGRYGDTGEGVVTSESSAGHFESGDHTAKKCAFLCEYAHAMGNAVGNFAEYWDVFYRHESLCGGCIWDWIDQAVWKDTDRVGADGRRERFLSYGGDFDEEPNDGPFNCNGVIDPLRNVTAKLIEVGHVQRNLVVQRPEGTANDAKDPVFVLWNRFCFTRADEFAGGWCLRENGVVTKRGTFIPPALEPLSRCRFTVPGLAEAVAAAPAGAELFVDFDFTTKKDEPWAQKGWSVARDQIRVGGASWDFGRAAKGGAACASVATDDRTLTVTCGGTRAVFCRRSGTLCELTMAGKTVLKDPAAGIPAGPLLTCGRAFVDNDRWIRDDYYARGLSQLRHHARPIVVSNDIVTVVTEVTGMKSAGFTQTSAWTFAPDGSVTVTSRVTPHGSMPSALPRLGFSLKLDKSLENLRYYGRGPRENYVDRLNGSFLGVWRSTVTGQFEPYVRPQDNGYKCDVRWAEFTDGRGRGVRFSASEPLFVQALHIGMEDLEFARHRNRQKRFNAPLATRGEVCLNLDVRQTGLGGASCGPKPMKKYIFPIEETQWTLRFEPVGRQAE